MTAESKKLWELIVASRLVQPQQLSELQGRAEAAGAADDASLWVWLEGQGVVSAFQRQLLRRGETGPFWYGDYLLIDRIAQGPWKGLFQARHARSGHMVALEFFSARNKFRGAEWSEAARIANQLATLNLPQLIPTLGTVVLPEHSFVVSDWSPARWLPQKVGYKSRVPWELAAPIAANVAIAAHALHECGITHGQIWPWTVELSGKSRARLRVNWLLDAAADAGESDSLDDYLAPEQLNGVPASIAGDMFSLGCLTYRLLTGRSATANGSTTVQKIDAIKHGIPIAFDKYGVPNAIGELVKSALAFQPTARPSSALVFAKQLCKAAGIEALSLYPVEASSPSLEKCKESLLGHRAPEPIAVAAGSFPAPTPVEEFQLPLAAERTAPMRAKASVMNRWLAPALAWGVMLLFVAVLAGGYVYLNRIPGPTADVSAGDAGIQIGELDASGTDLETVASTVIPTIQQTLVDDDGQMLWESPTTGPRLDVSRFPPGLRIIFSVRPRELLQAPQGGLIADGFGRSFRDWLEHSIAASGLPLDDIESLQVGFYSLGNPDYDLLIRVIPAQSVAVDGLVSAWSATQVVDDPAPSDGPRAEPIESVQQPVAAIYRNESQDFLIWIDPSNPQSASDLLMGPAELIRSAAAAGPLQDVSGVLRQLIEHSDSDRHINFICLASSLFNDEGQALMSGHWHALNRRLRLIFGDAVRGSLMSMHIDQGNYLEVILNHVPDRSTTDMVEYVGAELRTLRDEAIAAVAAMPAHPYWDRVRLRLDNMLLETARQTRIGSERGHVVMNAWLPPTGLHNLLSANQVFHGVAGVDVAADVEGSPSATSVPQSLEALLALPRTLKVTTNPDLNLLLQGIVDEVRTDHPDLPFEFEIRLAGTDLVLEGITQNQRPGDFEMVDTSLSEILTSIMVRANPDKSISGPQDANCKLVWAIEPADNGEGGSRIVITTRNAAAQRGLELPDAFRSGE